MSKLWPVDNTKGELGSLPNRERLNIGDFRAVVSHARSHFPLLSDIHSDKRRSGQTHPTN